MIIIVTENSTHFVNEKEYDVISHYREKAEAVCSRRDQELTYYNVNGVAFITDANKERYESGFINEENKQ